MVDKVLVGGDAELGSTLRQRDRAGEGGREVGALPAPIENVTAYAVG